MPNKELKKIMTNLAAGHINQKEADILMNEEKVAEEAPVDEIEGEVKPIRAQKRKLNAKKKILKKQEMSS